ncbi:MAG: LPS export ABC transporter ATP-binding protein [Candidatus Oxydemutatoraceae bacterium WSBS_2016_MAG_OTU14]
MEHCLQVENISKAYRKQKVIQSISMQVKSGEIVGLLGANGAGKTTIFSILMGLLRPDEGKVFIDQEDISSSLMHTRAQKGLAYLPQESSIFRRLSVVDNLRVSLEARRDLEDTAMAEEIEKLLNQFHLQEIRNEYGWALSGGQCRRVEIARTLACKPLFVLLDEPFANIDPISIREVQDLMLNLCQRNIGLIVTDHNVHATLRICHRAYIINRGELIATGNADEIIANKRVQEAYLGEEFRI